MAQATTMMACGALGAGVPIKAQVLCACDAGQQARMHRRNGTLLPDDGRCLHTCISSLGCGPSSGPVGWLWGGGIGAEAAAAARWEGRLLPSWAGKLPAACMSGCKGGPWGPPGPNRLPIAAKLATCCGVKPGGNGPNGGGGDPARWLPAPQAGQLLSSLVPKKPTRCGKHIQPPQASYLEVTNSWYWSCQLTGPVQSGSHPSLSTSMHPVARYLHNSSGARHTMSKEGKGGGRLHDMHAWQAILGPQGSKST